MAIFNSYVKLPEGRWMPLLHISRVHRLMIEKSMGFWHSAPETLGDLQLSEASKVFVAIGRQMAD